MKLNRCGNISKEGGTLPKLPFKKVEITCGQWSCPNLFVLFFPQLLVKRSMRTIPYLNKILRVANESFPLNNAVTDENVHCHQRV